jgi:hypothetical protein
MQSRNLDVDPRKSRIRDVSHRKHKHVTATRK